MAYIFFGGFFMALADSVPGVSGGTIAFIMGFYDKFITSLSILISGKKEEKLRALAFLLKLGIGWILGMGLAVTLLSGLFETMIYQVSSLFLGFVLVSLPLIYRQERHTLIGAGRYLPFALLGAFIVVALSSGCFSPVVSQAGFTVGTALYLVIAGILAVSAMVLPGISGSTLLMTFGLYVPIITVLKELLSFDFGNLWMVLCFGFGVVLGIVFSLPCLKKLLDHHRSAVIYMIFGMILGSFYAIIMGPTTLSVPRPMMTFSDFHLLWFAFGVGLMLALTLLKGWLIKHRRKIENRPGE